MPAPESLRRQLITVKIAIHTLRPAGETAPNRVPPMEFGLLSSQLKAHRAPRSCQARSAIKASIKRFGHCRTSGKCARLRTIREEQAQRETPSKKFVCRRWRMPERHSPRRIRGTKSPQGRNASRAWLVAYAPTEFSNPVLADPKARFCRSLATRQRDSSLPPGYPGASPGNPLTLRHLNQAFNPQPECLALL